MPGGLQKSQWNDRRTADISVECQEDCRNPSEMSIKTAEAQWKMCLAAVSVKVPALLSVKVPALLSVKVPALLSVKVPALLSVKVPALLRGHWARNRSINLSRPFYCLVNCVTNYKTEDAFGGQNWGIRLLPLVNLFKCCKYSSIFG